MKPILRKIDATHNCSFSIREDICPFLYNHWHYHPELELTYIRKGRGMRLVGDNIEQFEDGDLILLGTNLPHMWRSDPVYFEESSGLHIEAIAIHFREDFWGAYFLQLPEMKPIQSLLDLAKRGIKITGETGRLITEQMEQIVKASGAQRIESLLHMLNLISTSQEYVFLSSQGFSKLYDRSFTDRINLIYNYTFDNFQKPISIREVARFANLSHNSFCRYFKTRTLKTYWQFLLEIRIGYACKLLIENKMSIAHICYECGFNNLSNFNRHFKAREKMTPLQYHKTHASHVPVPA